MSKPKRKPGRPSTYTPELGAEICARMAEGRSLTRICKDDDDMPALSTVFLWLAEHSGFSERYAKAQEQRAQHLFDDLLAIADTPVEGETVVEKGDGTTEVRKGDMLGHRRLQVDTRKWALAKMLPKVYGDKIEHEHSGKVSLEGLVLSSMQAPADKPSEPEPKS